MNRFPKPPPRHSATRRPAPSRCDQRGAALLTTLVLATVIAVLSVSYLAVSQREAEATRSSVLSTRSELGERAAFEEAASLLKALTSEEGYLVTLAEREEGGRPARYTFLTRADAGGIVHVPLFAGGETLREPLPDFDGTETAALADRAVAAPRVSFPAAETARIVETGALLHLGPDGRPVAGQRRPETGLLELDPDGDGPYLTRYTYWVEDLEGFPNLDRLGHWSHPSNPSHSSHSSHSGGGPASPDETTLLRPGYGPDDSRLAAAGGRLPLEGAPGTFYVFPESLHGQSLIGQAAPGLSMREVALAPWPLPGLPAERHPYRGAHLPLQLGEWDTGPGLHDAWLGREGDAPRFVRGLHPYLDVPLVPFGHGYEDEGRPRLAINEWVARRDMGLVAEIKRNLPRFEERKGGFPEDYLATLVANLIDYADEDDLPSTPGNTVNPAGYVFRGVDSYATVNEFFVKFEYRGYRDRGDEYELVFVARPYAEFWNTFNRPARIAEAQLRLRFIEPVRFQANTRWYRIEEEHLHRDEPFENAAEFEIPPNGFHVHDFGEIEWRVPVDKGGSAVAFPVVQNLRAGIAARSTIRAHYELLLAGAPVDSSGRPRAGRAEPTESNPAQTFGFHFTHYTGVLNPGAHFMRSVVPSLDPEYQFQDGGADKGAGNHLGDPWMPYYSTSTTDDISASAYRNKATPGFRNLDLSKVAGNRRDWMRDQARVREWPDRGYDNPAATATPRNDDELPTDPEFAAPSDPRFAPWRISNAGRYHSVAELGNLHDPAMWAYGPVDGPDRVVNFSNQRYRDRQDPERQNPYLVGLPRDATPSSIWGGGNTLRVGRPEHPLFDQPGRRASQLLDLLHSGVAGSNLGPASGNAETFYERHDPRLHQPPPAAADENGAERTPYSLVYAPEEHAASPFRRRDGHINLNTAPTRFEVELLLRGARSSGDLLRLVERDLAPDYSDEAREGRASSLLKPEAIPLVARGLMEARPFYGPSHLARVFSELLARHEALPEAHNDAEAEEPFARLFNSSSLSSRHFRIHSAAEVRHRETGELVSRGGRVDEVFLAPVYDGEGKLLRSELRVLSSRRK